MNNQSMELTRTFGQLGKNDAALAGGKGASLGEMTQAGIPVPPGFVVLAGAFEVFLKEAGLIEEIDAILETVKTNEMYTVEHASEKIQALILQAKMPQSIASDIESNFKTLDAEFVAVRSSATAEDSASAAWAGQLDSFLNTTHAELLQNVQRCWASLFTPRAIFYRFEKELHLTKISVAVVVQKMVASECSGIAFSVHPVTEDPNQLIIEAGFGLGEAIVSGAVTPDSYVVEKSPRAILDITINTQTRALYRSTSSRQAAAGGGNAWVAIPEPKASSQVLTKEQILELSELILKIENHYTFPCDIEWAFEADTFYIVQSRPITTLQEVGAVSNAIYEKAYTRENSLLAYQIWEEHQTRRIEKILEWVAEPALFTVTEGVAEVYYKNGTFDKFDMQIAAMLAKDPQFIQKTMDWYGGILDYLEEKWQSKKPLTGVEELATFYDKAIEAWCGLDISYEAPKMDAVKEKDKQLAMSMRERAADFLEETDHVLTRTLQQLYPELGGLVTYLRVEEVTGKEKFPSVQTLEERKKHFIYYKYKVTTGVTLKDFSLQNELTIVQESVEGTNGLKGQTAFKGVVQGRVRVLNKKSEIPQLLEGEILVTAMTTPDYLPAMHKAAAFVTDEGGITCHAAIVARELKKPCVIGTKFATQLLKTGDMVEVDAERGVVTILKRA